MSRLNKVTSDVDIKADVDKRIITGYAAIFDSLDSDRDVIQKGAFAHTIQHDFNPPGEGKSRVKLLWQHKRHEVIGRPFLLQEDSKGLLFKSRVSKTMRGDEALELIRDHAVDEMSFGFDVMKSHFIDWMGEGMSEAMRVRLLTQLKLWEISPVTWGANSSTSVEQSKAVRLDALIKSFTSSEVSPDQVSELEALLSSRITELEGLRSSVLSGKNKGYGESLTLKESGSIFAALDNFNNFLSER